MLKEFREFAMRGSVVDMAVGIIIGAAFGTVISSLVDHVLMPPIGLLLGGIDVSNWFAVLRDGMPPGPYQTFADAQAAGAVIVGYGAFINAVISFLIVAFAVFLVIRNINAMRRLQKPEAPPAPTQECRYCASTIPVKATRCPHCTSQLA